MAGIWRAGRCGKRRDREGSDGEQEHGRHRTDGGGMERLGPVAEAADEERQTEHQQGVGEDGANEGRLDHDHEARAQGEDRDEQLGEIAERRLEDASRPRSEPLTELVSPLADEHRKRGQRDGADDEDDRLTGAHRGEDEGRDRRGDGDDRDDGGRATDRRWQRSQALHRRRMVGDVGCVQPAQREPAARHTTYRRDRAFWRSASCM